MGVSLGSWPLHFPLPLRGVIGIPGLNEPEPDNAASKKNEKFQKILRFART